MEKQFENWIIGAAKLSVYAAIIVIVLGMIFGAADLLIHFTKEIVSHDPPFVVEVKQLISIFSTCLIIIIGYELTKSFFMILSSNVIPVTDIAKIAAIAVMNKMITSDYAEVEGYKIAAIGFVLVSISLAYFFFRKDENETTK
jgi:uncharacterized membrane protein (DUF373 family)